MERRRDRRRADGALRGARRPRSSRRPPDHFVLRPADRVAPVHSARSRPVERGVARDLLFGRAARSGRDREGAARLGTDAARLLRPDRDDDDGRQSAGAEAGGRRDGTAAAGLPRRAARRRGTRVRLRRDFFAALGPTPRTDAPVISTTTARCRRSKASTFAPATSLRATGRASSLMSAAPTTCSNRATIV